MIGMVQFGSFMEQGGVFVWLQLAMGLIGLAFAGERLFFFHRARVNVTDLLLGLNTHVKRLAFAEARHEAARAPGPMARVAHAVLVRPELPRADLRDIAQEAGQLEVPRIERNVRAIHGVAMLAPLVGLLGTVLNMIDVFQKMQQRGGSIAASELATAMFQSLLSAALGLMIATVLQLIYCYFLGRAQRLLHRLERTGIEMVNMVCDARREQERRIELEMRREVGR